MRCAIYPTRCIDQWNWRAVTIWLLTCCDEYSLAHTSQILEWESEAVFVIVKMTSVYIRNNSQHWTSGSLNAENTWAGFVVGVEELAEAKQYFSIKDWAIWSGQPTGNRIKRPSDTTEDRDNACEVNCRSTWYKPGSWFNRGMCTTTKWRCSVCVTPHKNVWVYISMNRSAHRITVIRMDLSVREGKSILSMQSVAMYVCVILISWHGCSD